MKRNPNIPHFKEKVYIFVKVKLNTIATEK